MHVERFVEVSEAAVAAVLQERDRFRGKRVGAVVTGGNVDWEVFLTTLGGI